MSEDVFSDQDDLTERTWNRLRGNLRKDGFREGALKGREESYQNGFNAGYSEGYKIGEALGSYKGFRSLCVQLNLEKPHPSQCQKHLDEHEVDKACILCRNKNFSSNIGNIIEQQQQKNAVIFNDLSQQHLK